VLDIHKAVEAMAPLHGLPTPHADADG